MKLFSHLYDKMMQWARHKHAPYYLAGISFSESSFFPIPPDFMLAPMSLARPDKAIWYATITTVTSVLGALLGYCIGMFFFDLVQPWIAKLGYADAYATVQHWFSVWGFWILFLAGSVSPVPFKLFTIAAGALHMALLPFVIGSFVGRGARFYLVSFLMRLGGAKMDQTLRRWVDYLGWIVLVLAVLGYVIYRCVR